MSGWAVWRALACGALAWTPASLASVEQSSPYETRPAVLCRARTLEVAQCRAELRQDLGSRQAAQGRVEVWVKTPSAERNQEGWGRFYEDLSQLGELYARHPGTVARCNAKIGELNQCLYDARKLRQARDRAAGTAELETLKAIPEEFRTPREQSRVEAAEAFEERVADAPEMEPAEGVAPEEARTEPAPETEGDVRRRYESARSEMLKFAGCAGLTERAEAAFRTLMKYQSVKQRIQDFRQRDCPNAQCRSAQRQQWYAAQLGFAVRTQAEAASRFTPDGLVASYAGCGEQYQALLEAGMACFRPGAECR